MKKFLIKLGVAGIIVAFVAVSFFSIQAAEKTKIEVSFKTLRPISESTPLRVDLSTGMFMGQVLRLNWHTSSNSDFDGNPVLIYEQWDGTQGTGKHSGYAIIIHKNGDEHYEKYEGTHKGSDLGGGVYGGTYEGKLQYTGGTGKFKNLKGSGTYKGEFKIEGGKETSMGTYVAEAEY